VIEIINITWNDYSLSLLKCNKLGIRKNETESKNGSAKPVTVMGKEFTSHSGVSWPLTRNRHICKWGKQWTWLVCLRVRTSLCRVPSAGAIFSDTYCVVSACIQVNVDVIVSRRNIYQESRHVRRMSYRMSFVNRHWHFRNCDAIVCVQFGFLIVSYPWRHTSAVYGRQYVIHKNVVYLPTVCLLTSCETETVCVLYNFTVVHNWPESRAMLL